MQLHRHPAIGLTVQAAKDTLTDGQFPGMPCQSGSALFALPHKGAEHEAPADAWGLDHAKSAGDGPYDNALYTAMHVNFALHKTDFWH